MLTRVMGSRTRWKVYKELCLQESWAVEQGECSQKYVQLGAWNIQKDPFKEEIGVTLDQNEA